MKNKAVQLYLRLLPSTRTSRWRQGDVLPGARAARAGHLRRDAQDAGDLTRKYPPPLRLESEQIIGDYYFDKRTWWRRSGTTPPSSRKPPRRCMTWPLQAGWIRVNQAKHAEAVVFFEAAAPARPCPAWTRRRRSTSSARPAGSHLQLHRGQAGQGALNYFEKLSDSRATFALALDKLGNRYFIKSQYEWAIPALRKLMEIQFDPSWTWSAGRSSMTRSRRQGQVMPEPADLRFLVRAAVQSKTDPSCRGRPQRQLTEWRRWRETCPRSSTGRAEEERQGHVHHGRGGLQGVLSLFRRSSTWAHHEEPRGRALLRGRLPDAARQFEELAATRRRPSSGTRRH